MNKLKVNNYFNDLIIHEKKSLKNEILAPIILVIIILIFCAPMLLLLEGVCADDAAFQSFPKKVAVARAFKQGEVPFWDYHEFCGGKPFYIMLENPVYNIFFYPFYFLADINNIDQSFYVLYILPLTLLVIISGLGAYFLARFYFKFGYLISILFGFLWAVNPSMALSNYSTINTTVFTFIPWIILSLASFLETKKWQWWIVGSFCIALFNIAYTVNYPVRVYFTFLIIFGILSLWYIKQNWKNIFTILLTFFAVITGFLLSAFIFAHLLEAAKYSSEQFKLTYNNIVDFIPNSMPPTHLITMFIPNFNGSLDNLHSWGDGLLIYSADRNLTGGIFTSFALIVSFAILIFYKDWKIELEDKIKIWLIISIIVNIFILLVMMGRYTPIYYLACKLIPWIFLIPYPFYFHFAHHLAALILIGFGLSFLFEKYKKELFNNIHFSFAFYYIGFIALFAIVYLLAPVPSTRIPAYKFLIKYKELFWFLTNPFLYFIGASLLFIYIFYKRKKNFEFFKWVVLIGIFIEAFYIGYIGYYKNLIMPRPYERNNYEKLQRPHYTLPSKDPYYKHLNELKEIAKNDFRWASDVTSTDGISWIVNARTLGGYDSKPIISNTRLILREVYQNFPYQLNTCAFPKNLLSNLNVGALVVYDCLEHENKIFEYIKDEVSYYLIREPQIYEEYGTGEQWSDYFFDKSFNGPNLKIHYIEKPMPYIYFQNKLFFSSLSEQKNSLLYDDLRKYALLSSEALNDFPEVKNLPLTKEERVNIGNKKEEFELLQQQNQILLEKRKYNTHKLLVNIQQPCLLIKNETYHPDWEVYIDGKKAKIYKVNYALQGVKLTEGKHEIVFKFFPAKLKIAFIISGLTLFSLLIFITTMTLLERNKKSKRGLR